MVELKVGQIWEPSIELKPEIGIRRIIIGIRGDIVDMIFYSSLLQNCGMCSSTVEEFLKYAKLVEE